MYTQGDAPGLPRFFVMTHVVLTEPICIMDQDCTQKNLAGMS